MENLISPQHNDSEPETGEKKDRSLLYMSIGLGAVILIMGYLAFFVEDINTVFSKKETAAAVVNEKSDLSKNSAMSDEEVRNSLIKFVEAFYYDQRKGYFDPPSYFAEITETYYNFHNLTYQRLREIRNKRLSDMHNLEQNWIVSSLDFNRNEEQLVVTYWTRISYLKPSVNKQESEDVKNEMIINTEGKIISLREIEIKNFTSSDAITEADTSGGEETGYTDPSEEQSSSATPSDHPESRLYDLGTVEVSPEYPGGLKALGLYIASNLRYPIAARENKIEGKVYVGFIVEKNGNLSDLKIIKGIGGGCDEEALKVLKSCPPWRPGLFAGKPVRTSFTLPITFQLAN